MSINASLEDLLLELRVQVQEQAMQLCTKGYYTQAQDLIKAVDSAVNEIEDADITLRLE